MDKAQLRSWLKARKTYYRLYKAATAFKLKTGDDRPLSVLDSASNNAADSVGPESHPEYWSIALGSIHDAIEANCWKSDLFPWFAKHGFVI